MPPTDDDELRALQHKAYGRDGGLTDAEAARLRELEALRSPAASAPAASSGTAASVREKNARSGGGIGADAPPERAKSSPAAGAADADDERDRESEAQTEPETPGGTRRALRQHWRIVAAASAVLVALGLAAGWMLFGRGFLPAIVPAGQQPALAMIEEGSYDPGSIRFAGEKHGVGIWHATRDGGTRDCIIVTREEQQASECRDLDAETDLNSFYGVSAGLDFEEDGQMVTVWATFLPDISGEQVTLVQRSVIEEGVWESQFTELERADMERLQQEDFEPASLQIIGRDGELTIWQGWRGEETCLAAVVDGEPHVSCSAIASEEEDLRLRIGTTEYTIARGTGTFTITRNLSPADGTDPLELGGEHGDPIEVTPEGPEP